jgi:hypothetical protein
LTLAVAGQTLTYTPEALQNWNDYKRADMGSITISQPGDDDLKLTGTLAKAGVVNLQTLTLTP